MAGYGKINIETNYLMSSQKQHDSTWIPLADFAKDSDGNFYTYYIDKNTPDADKELKIVGNNLTVVLSKYIQDEVDKFNSANGLGFGGIHNVANYINTPTYTHHAWCVAVWAWNVNVWETGRIIQEEVVAGTRPVPTEDELIALLPAFTI